MTKLKLGPLADDKPVKISLAACRSELPRIFICAG